MRKTRRFFSFFTLLGFILFLTTFLSVISTIFQIELEFFDIVLPKEWGGVILFFVPSALFTSIGVLFSSEKLNQKMKENRGLTFLLVPFYFAFLALLVYLAVIFIQKDKKYMIAAEKNNVKVIKKYFTENSFQKEIADKLLVRAVFSKSKDVVNYLLKLGADPNYLPDNNEDNFHLLLRAVNHSSPEVVDLLLKYGANINVKDPFVFGGPIINTISGPNSTLDKIKICKLLLKRGANINETDDFLRTPVFKAVELFDFKVTEFLLKNNADINRRDHMKETPIFKTVTFSNRQKVGEDKRLKVLVLILEHKPDLTIKNHMNRTVLEEAKVKGFLMLAGKLENYSK